MLLQSRRLNIPQNRSCLLLGARQTGKSTWLRHQCEHQVYIDLLMSDVFFEYQSHPELLRQRYAQFENTTIVIDDIQKIPELINEVHWLVENTSLRFILSGSSARKLRKQGVTNLAGRLKSRRMLPLTFKELDQYELVDRLQYGSLPPIVFSEDPGDDLKDYCGEYLKEEIYAESLVRQIGPFTRFLEMAAIGNTQLLSYSTIAKDCGITSKTVKEYYQILEDTLLGYHLMPFIKTQKRKSISTPKFYFFDTGLPQCLLNRKLSPKTPEFGQAFEHGMILEAFAQMFYDRNIESLKYWRSKGGVEVDLIINEALAVEFKSGKIDIKDCKGLLALSEELNLKEKWLVCMEEQPRQLPNQIEVLPWKTYLERLSEL